MTAIKPIENRRVQAVSATTYPINSKCAVPDCDEDAHDPHHAFPRSAIGGDSWFVVIVFDTFDDAIDVLGKRADVTEVPIPAYVNSGKATTAWYSGPVPHVIGLCRTHHEWAESRVAKIVLDGGTWSWWESNDRGEIFEEVGPLNPQPGSRTASRKKPRFKGDARRKRKVVSIRVPSDAEEDGAGLLDEAIEAVEAKIQGDDEHRPPYYTLMNALDYTILNADETDFVDE